MKTSKRTLPKYHSKWKLARRLAKAEKEALKYACPYEGYRLYLGTLELKHNDEIITFDLRNYSFKQGKLIIYGVNFTHMAGYSSIQITPEVLKLITLKLIDTSK